MEIMQIKFEISLNRDIFFMTKTITQTHIQTYKIDPK